MSIDPGLGGAYYRDFESEAKRELEDWLGIPRGHLYDPAGLPYKKTMWEIRCEQEDIMRENNRQIMQWYLQDTIKERH